MSDEQTSIADLISHALVGVTTAQRMLTAARPRAGADAVELESLRDKVAELREIIEGRTAPPTAEETAAHLATGGSWMVTRPMMGHSFSDVLYAQHLVDHRLSMGGAARWHALDASGCPCAWPRIRAEGVA